MISLDQVLMLKNKVDSAVESITRLNGENAQLKAENAALRSKCAELTKALTDSTEQVSSLESEQNRIEEGIISALNKLNTVENTVLAQGGAGESLEENWNKEEGSTPLSGEIMAEEDYSSASQEFMTEKTSSDGSQNIADERPAPDYKNNFNSTEEKVDSNTDSTVNSQFDIF